MNEDENQTDSSHILFFLISQAKNILQPFLKIEKNIPFKIGNISSKEVYCIHAECASHV